MSVPANNVKFTWTANEIDYEYQCPIDPSISWTYGDLANTQVLGNQLDVDDWIGQRVNFKLGWKEPVFIKGDQLYELAKMRNDFVAICFFPAPDDKPALSFLVKIPPNGFLYDLVRGTKIFGYELTVILLGDEILDGIPLNSILMCDA